MSQFNKISLFVLAILFSGSLIAQEFKKNPVSKTNINTNENIIPGTIVLKLKPEFRHFTNNITALKNIPALTEVLKKYKIEKFVKMFPSINETTKSAISRNNKQKGPDLSLMHVLNFNPEIPIYELIDKLIASGLVEYAEPQYLVEMQYLPNDPISQPTASGELLLQRINAYKAWDIEKGDPNVVIGVLDTGTELTHKDLINNLKLNLADPIDGSDNDLNGYIDDYYGWDTGNGDNNPTFEYVAGNPFHHGIKVQGACSATPDNNIFTTGTGYNCKCLPVKISTSSGSLSGGYAAIQYAAKRGVKVMNLSWGGFSAYSQASQDIINDAALTKDVLIIAAAGNKNIDGDIYPGSYDNVFSVAGLDTITSPLYDTLVEIRQLFDPIELSMTYSFKVDLSSLQGGWSSTSGDSSEPFGGSSFSSPTVAGAAALVRSKYPQLSAIQAGELLRVTGDILDTFDVTLPESRYKIGRKLNMYKSLSSPTIPSVRMLDFAVTGKHGQKFFSGDTLTITNDFFNYLSKANNLTIKMICNNGFATVYDSTSNLGLVDSLTGKNNISDPFKIIINQNAGIDQVIELVLILTDPSKNYYDYQGFKFIVNPAYLDIDTNKIKTTITSNGRIGYNTFPTTNGLGLTYLNNPLLFEGGLMIGTSTTKVSDCIRSSYPFADNEFEIIKSAHYVNSTIKDQEARSTFNDSSAISGQILGVEIEQKSYAWKNTPNDKFVIIEYNITNKSATTYDSIFAGIYTDWDIADPNYNRADWDDARKVAYTYSTLGGSKVAGVALLTDNVPSCYSLEYPAIGGSINAYGNFNTTRKYNSMAYGVARKQAGMASFGSEVSQVTSAKILNFTPGKTETVAFAFIAADNIFELLTVAQSARDKFVSIKQGPVPMASNTTICRQDTIDLTITPTNGTKFAFFNTPTSTTPLFTGPSYTMLNVSQDDTIYVANKDSLFYSNLKSVYIKKDNMILAYFPSTDTIQLPVGGSLLLVNQSFGASSISWDLGDATTATGNSVTHIYNTQGYYTIKLSGISPMNCYDTLTRVLKVQTISNTAESLNGTELKFYPNPVSNILTIDFENNNLPEDLSMELINALGTTILMSQGTKNTTLNMSEYPSGIYYVKLKSGGNVVNKKIVKY